MARLIYLLIFCILFFSNFAHSQTKRALVVAIGDYPEDINNIKNSWRDLSSANDYEIIYQMLLNQDFKTENIVSLIDSQATASALDNKFSQLLSDSETGDMIYFHFSGHGQQVTDVSHDLNSISDTEEDGYDESLVMYFAPKQCKDNYDMLDHYIDDRLNYWITEIRKKIVNGHVIMVLDACHSGTSSRGSNDENRVRGSRAKCDVSSSGSRYSSQESNSRGFELDLLSSKKQLSDLVVFSGCRADEINREYNGYGSLSYAFVKGIESLSSKESTYYDLYGYINEFIETSVNQTIGMRQHPQIEPSESRFLKIFNGDFIPSDYTYRILSKESKSIEIDAGKINSKINIGDKVIFSLIGREAGVELEGEVIKVHNFRSEIYIKDENFLDILTAKQYHNFKELFECKLAYSFKIIEQKLSVNVDVSEIKERREIISMIKESYHLEYDKKAKYIIVDSSDLFIIKCLTNNLIVQNMKPSHYDDNYFQDILLSLLEIESVIENNLDSEKIDLVFEQSKDNPELLRISDTVDFNVENRSNRSVYFYLYEITPNCVLNNVIDGKLIRNKEKGDFPYIFDDIGNHTFLIIASDQKITLNNLNQLAETSSIRGEVQPSVDWSKYVVYIQD